MNKETILFVNDLKAVFKKHDVYLDVDEKFGGNEMLFRSICGD